MMDITKQLEGQRVVAVVEMQGDLHIETTDFHINIFNPITNPAQIRNTVGMTIHDIETFEESRWQFSIGPNVFCVSLKDTDYTGPEAVYICGQAGETHIVF